MKKIFFTFFLVVVTIAVSSCNKGDGMDAVSVAGGVLSDDVIELSPTTGEYSLAFTSDRPWNLVNNMGWNSDGGEWVSGDRENGWLHVDKIAGGQGTTVITFNADLNESRKNRTVTLKFEAYDKTFSTEITVTQPYPYLKLNTDDFNLSFDYDQRHLDDVQQVIDVESNVKWTIKEVASPEQSLDNFYLSVSSKEGDYKFSPGVLYEEGESKLGIIPNEYNFGKEQYYATFNIVPVLDNGEEIPEKAADRYTLFLNQDNFLFLLNGSAEGMDIELSEIGDSLVVKTASSEPDSLSGSATILVECEKSWHIADAPDWVNFSSSGDRLTIAADGPAPLTDSREGIVSLVAEAEENVVREIQVMQHGYTLELDDLSEIVIPCDDLSEYHMKLTTVGGWRILDIPEWLDVSPTSGGPSSSSWKPETFDIMFKVNQENLDFESHVSNLRFSRTSKPSQYVSSSDPLDVKKSIVHEEFFFDVDPNPILSSIPTFNNDTYSVTVKCSGNWVIESVPEWVYVSEVSGEKGETRIQMGAKNGNPDENSDRSAVIEFVSLKHKDAGIDASRNFTILQRKYTFELGTIAKIPAYKSDFPQYPLHLQCSAEWALIDWPDWLSPDITGGDGMEDVDIMFTPQINSASSSRNGTIRIRDSYKGEERSVSVSQDGFVFNTASEEFTGIEVMNTRLYPVTFEITAEAPWEIVADDWIVPSAFSGVGADSGISSVSFTPAPNPSLSERTGVAVIRSLVNGAEKQIEFRQNQYLFDDSEEDFHYSELSTAVEQLYVECSGPWTVNAPSWVSFSSQQGSSSQNVSVRVSNNLTLEQREAVCVITSTLNGLTREINVSQDAFEFDYEPLAFNWSAIDEKSEVFEITSSGSWTAMNVPSWANLSDSNGIGSEDGVPQKVSISLDNNLEESERTATIAFTSDDNPAFVKNITIKQEGFVFEVSATTCNFSASGAERPVIDIECSGEWTATANAGWVDIANINSDSFRIIVEKNDSESERRTSVIVKSVLNGMTVSIEIIQAGRSN